MSLPDWRSLRFSVVSEATLRRRETFSVTARRMADSWLDALPAEAGPAVDTNAVIKSVVYRSDEVGWEA